MGEDVVMKARRLLFLLFFLSGFSALSYEVVWARKLALVLGNTVYAVSVILAVFFAGLALGSYFLGKWIDKKGQPLKTYAFLELGIGVYAAATPWIFRLIEKLQVSFGPTSSGFSLLTFIFSFVALILPTALMGGTLPVISKALSVERQAFRVGRDVGLLYFLNTAGAVLGAFLAGFLMIAYLGVNQTIWVAAGINLLIGIVVLASSGEHRAFRDKRLAARGEKQLTPREEKERRTLYPVLLAFFLAGFAALSLEVLWMRVLILTFGSSTYAFSTILTVFLLGIALGSFLASKFLVERENLLFWLAGLEICLGIVVILLTPLLGKLPLLSLSFYKQTAGFATNLQIAFAFSFLVMLLPTLLMGAAFPLVVKAYSGKRLASSVGEVYAVNTLGGILGSLAAGFVLIPFLGLQEGVIISSLFYFLAGILVLSLLPLSSKVKAGVVFGVILLAAGAFFLPSWDKDVLSSGVFVYFQDYLEAMEARTEMEKGALLFYKEGLSATVAVKKDKDNLYMRINGKTDASTLGDRENFLLTGHLPLLLHPNPCEVLVIGLGSGITLGAVEQHPVEAIDLVEIEPAVVEGAALFSPFNHNALEDERLQVIVDDGRHFLLTTKKNYDIISSQPSNPWIAGMGNLFTQEYFKLAASHLKDEGLMLQWIQLYSLSSSDLKTAIATFQSVFPYVSSWVPPFSDDLLLVGAKKPFEIDFLALDKKIKEKKVQEDLSGAGIKEAAALLGYFVAGKERLARFSQGAPLNTDNHPILEFSAPFSLGKETIGENLELLLKAQEKPYFLLPNVSPWQKKKIEVNLALKENVFRGKIAFTKGNLEDALNYFLEALKIDLTREQTKKELASIYFYQAEEAFAQRDFEKAKELLTKSAEFDPTHPLTFLNLGAIYFQEGNFTEAERQWKKAYELDPERPETVKNLELLERVRD